VSLKAIWYDNDLQAVRFVKIGKSPAGLYDKKEKVGKPKNQAFINAGKLRSLML